MTPVPVVPAVAPDDYDRGRTATRILALAGNTDNDGNRVGVAVGTSTRCVEVDPVTMVRLLDNVDRLRAERDAALARALPEGVVSLTYLTDRLLQLIDRLIPYRPEKEANDGR